MRQVRICYKIISFQNNSEEKVTRYKIKLTIQDKKYDKKSNQNKRLRKNVCGGQ